jgi:hypothetical protein
LAGPGGRAGADRRAGAGGRPAGGRGGRAARRVQTPPGLCAEANPGRAPLSGGTIDTPDRAWFARDMGIREKLLDPTGDSERTVDTTLSPRPGRLRGLTVGLLDNAKANAAVLLSGIGDVLRREHGVQAAVAYTKSYFGQPVEESLIQQILHNCDFVVAGIGD